MAKEAANPTKRPASVKSSCEDLIQKGKTIKQALVILRKRFPDKDDATFEKSMKYYASALFRAGTIDEDTRSKYVGSVGRGKTAEKKAASKVEKKTAKKAPAKKAPAKKASTEKVPAKKSAAQGSAKTSKRSTKKTSK